MNSNFKNRGVALLLTLLATSAWAQESPQRIDVPLSRPGEPMSLEINLLSAYIEVVGEDRQDVQIEVAAGEAERKIITPSGARSLKAATFALEVEEDDNHVEVDAGWRAGKLRVVVRIPRQADLELGTVNDGEIVVRDVTGNLQLHNTNGPITASGISGSVIAETVNEIIDVRFRSLDANSAHSLRSVNGDLVLGLPASAGADLRIDSAEGEISSDFDVEVTTSPPVVSREETRNGVEVRVESVIVARVKGGGPVVDLKTLNGDIRILESN